MKKLMCILIILTGLSQSSASGQTWDELFNQRKTQTKYLLEQIAALRVYIDHVQKTYRIAKEGLDFIGKATKGEFDLHDAFFHSLKNVNPTVSKYHRVADILAMQTKIISTTKQCNRALQQTQALRADEIAYIKSVFRRILNDCAQILEDLKAVTSSGRLEMKDDERIERINALYDEMQQNYLITQNFGNGAIQLAIARQRDKADYKNSRILNSIKK